MTLEDRLLKRFCCAKCFSTKAISNEVIVKVPAFFIDQKTYISLSCLNCGFAEFYDREVLESGPSISSNPKTEAV